MILKIVAIRDRAADVFGQPNFVTSLGAAIRGFGDEINRKSDSVLYQHPEDFDLYHLGEYDDSTATFHTGVPKQIAIGKDLRVNTSGD